MVISSFPDLKAMLHTLPPKPAVVAAAHDAHTLQAVFAARRDGLIHPILVGHREEILSIANDPEKTGFIRTMWCEDPACEARMKEEAGVTSRCMPLEQERLYDVCPICGKPAKSMIIWGKAY